MILTNVRPCIHLQHNFSNAPNRARLKKQDKQKFTAVSKFSVCYICLKFSIRLVSNNWGLPWQWAIAWLGYHQFIGTEQSLVHCYLQALITRWNGYHGVLNSRVYSNLFGRNQTCDNRWNGYPIGNNVWQNLSYLLR